MYRTTARRFLNTMSPTSQGLLFGVLVSMLLVGADQLAMHAGLTESERIVDDVLGGAVAGVVVLRYARMRLTDLEERLNTVALMNHHIRNALQVIRYRAYIQPAGEEVAAVEDAVKRIDWALREVLPGRIHELDQGWKESSPSVPQEKTSAASSPSQIHPAN